MPKSKGKLQSTQHDGYTLEARSEPITTASESFHASECICLLPFSSLRLLPCCFLLATNYGYSLNLNQRTDPALQDEPRAHQRAAVLLRSDASRAFRELKANLLASICPPPGSAELNFEGSISAAFSANTPKLSGALLSFQERHNGLNSQPVSRAFGTHLHKLRLNFQPLLTNLRKQSSRSAGLSAQFSCNSGEHPQRGR